MIRPLVRGAIALALVAWATGAADARAQQWDTPEVDALLDRAAARRSANDSTLRAWSAEAVGTLRFLVDLGETGVLGPRTVKVDQLATVLQWRQPGRTEQRIVGRRDTLVLPGDVGFYRDRYGVITNNLGDRVVLGDGHDVRDLPHPLSAEGRRRHSFALVDSLGMQMPGKRVEVYELRVKPRVEGEPAMVGSLWLDRETGDVVRLAVTFTRAAILDARIERLSLVLENLLVEGAYWLPHRQELEVSRRSTWLDFPVRGIVRARWEVCCHEVLTWRSPAVLPRLPTSGTVLLANPGQVVRLAPPEERAGYAWPDSLARALAPDEQLATERESREVRRRAEELVQGRLLDRATGAGVSGRRISDFARYNRVEGLALGAGAAVRLAPAWALALQGSYGFSDEEVKGRAELRWRVRDGLVLRAYGERSYRDASDVAEVSGVRNSVGALVAGDDNTNPYEVRGGGVGADAELGERTRLALTLSRERQDALRVEADPLGGTFGPTIPATPLDATRLDATLTRRYGGGPLGSTWTWRLNGRVSYVEPRDGAGASVVGRLAAVGEAQWPLGASTLVLGTAIAGVTAQEEVPPQELVRFGGITTGPGYSFHEFAGRLGWSQRVELRVPVPFVSLPLLTWGRSPPSATLAPYGHLACIAERSGGDDGCYPSLGVAGMFVFDLLRLDVAYGLRDGGWRFGVDVGRVVWGIL